MEEIILPKEWTWVRLGDLVDNPMQDLVDGPFGSNLKSDEYIESGIPVFKIQNIKVNRFVDKRISFISKKKAKSLIRHSFQTGDLIITKLGEPLGLCCKVPAKYPFGIIVADLMRLRPSKSKIYDDFLLNVINSDIVKKQFKSITKGTTRARVNLTIVRDIKIPLPPKETQYKIVSKIEELCSELDKGIENLTTALQQLLIYRKTVIMEGVTGKLTANWRTINPDADNSEKVFTEIQNQINKSFKAAFDYAVSKGQRKPKDHRKNKKTINIEIKLPELPATWKYYRLEDITYLVTDGTHFTPKYQEKGVIFLSVKNVRPFYFRLQHVKYISEKEHKSLIERCNPQKNDILYTKVGATFGYAAKVTMEYDFSIFVSLCLIKPVYEYFSSSFLEILMNSELVFRQARKRVSGSGVPDLHLIEIRDFKIPLPSLKEQQMIVQEIESRLSVADKMEESITQSLQQAGSLRQSILKQAFEGKLI
jgi:type I restriction enzyme S subunit